MSVEAMLLDSASSPRRFGGWADWRAVMGPALIVMLSDTDAGSSDYCGAKWRPMGLSVIARANLVGAHVVYLPGIVNSAGCGHGPRARRTDRGAFREGLGVVVSGYLAADKS